jgi:hypothetical protein
MRAAAVRARFAHRRAPHVAAASEDRARCDREPESADRDAVEGTTEPWRDPHRPMLAPSPHPAPVVDLGHRVFGGEQLYVVDASAIPGPLGVNPQVTIMASALRAAESVEQDVRA